MTKVDKHVKVKDGTKVTSKYMDKSKVTTKYLDKETFFNGMIQFAKDIVQGLKPPDIKETEQDIPIDYDNFDMEEIEDVEDQIKWNNSNVEKNQHLK